ncbi:MAG: hypothetical protein QGH02_08105, partial [Verrucomicrobiota bacterium]|nr:hypothetical protein [Verrucomicrobiota bacterium]
MKNYRVHATHWLISTQLSTEDRPGADGLFLSLSFLLGVADRLLLGQRRGGRRLLRFHSTFELLAAQRALGEGGDGVGQRALRAVARL